jgi:hypothetical protein
MLYHRVYQFRPDVRPRDLDTLVASQLYSARVAELNDPFEFVALRELESFPDKLNEYRCAGVTSFCRVLTHPLLWSHYADGHAGFAVGYNAAHEFFGRNRGVLSSLLHDVRYEDAPPTFSRYGLSSIGLAAATTKPTCWSYEQELRVIRQHGGERFNIPRDMIREVVFGSRMSRIRAAEISKAVSENGICADFTHMRFSSSGYWLFPTPGLPGEGH